MSASTGDRPVLVVGAGPVGQTTALLLARRGIPVILVDSRAARDVVGSKAICQQRDVLDIWESVGAGRRIAAEGVTWTVARTFHRDRELFSYPVADPGASEFPVFVNISQTRTEQILDECIAGEPLIQCRWGQDIVELQQDSEGVLARTADESIERGAYAVLCAGSRADALREGLGITFDGRSFDDRFLICDIRAEIPGWAAERRFYFDPKWNPGRQILIHPCPDSTFRIDWQVPSDYTAQTLSEEMADGRLEERIRAIVGDTDYEVVWSSVYRFHTRCASRMRAGRILLAGDAAHLVSPFGARGLNSGVADAENAAWKIAFVYRSWAGPDLLETYHDERHAAALENVAVTTDTMNFLVPATAEHRKRRLEVLERAGYDGSAHADVNSGRLAEPFWYCDSPLTTPDPGRPFPGRPPRGQLPPPGPGVLVPDAPIDHPEHRRLRELLRAGMCLLHGRSINPDIEPLATDDWPGPITIVGVTELDPNGSLAQVLDLRPCDVWVIRPDAYIAATLHAPSAAQIRAAVHRALGAGEPASTPHPISEEERRGPLPAAR